MSDHLGVWRASITTSNVGLQFKWLNAITKGLITSTALPVIDVDYIDWREEINRYLAVC